MHCDNQSRNSQSLAERIIILPFTRFRPFLAVVFNLVSPISLTNVISDTSVMRAQFHFQLSSFVFPILAKCNNAFWQK